MTPLETVEEFISALEKKDIDAAISQVRIAVEKLRLLSPLWDMFKAGIDLNTVQWSAH